MPAVPPDQTLPDAQRLAAASDVLKSFAQATFNDDLDPKPKPKAAPKRKADSSAQAADVTEVNSHHDGLAVAVLPSVVTRKDAGHESKAMNAGRLGWPGRVRNTRAEDNSRIEGLLRREQLEEKRDESSLA